jgi:hypothetical protein
VKVSGGEVSISLYTSAWRELSSLSETAEKSPQGDGISEFCRISSLFNVVF